MQRIMTTNTGQGYQSCLEPATGVQPAYSAWEAGGLPLTYAGVVPYPLRRALRHVWPGEDSCPLFLSILHGEQETAKKKGPLVGHAGLEPATSAYVYAATLPSELLSHITAGYGSIPAVGLSLLSA